MAFNPYYGYTPQYGKTPYYMQQPITTPQYQPQTNDYMQNIQPAYQKPIILQGKSVDNIEVVRATDIPLDGSVSYFPLADGTAIATKQLMQDGTSKITIFKPSNEENQAQQIKYVTENDLKEQLSNFNSKDIKDIKEELKSLKKRIREITDELEEKKEEE